MKHKTDWEKLPGALGATAFWLVVWQLCSVAIGKELLLPSPLLVLGELARLVVTGGFWLVVLVSLGRIALGFFLGLLVAVVLAVAASLVHSIEILLRPLMLLVRAIPVASFIILALVWVSGRKISILTSFLMVLPVVYGSLLSGIREADGKLLEMAEVFRVPFWRQVRAIYLPALLPAFISGCELSLGLCWKSGVAAEIIGLPPLSIGAKLHEAKIYLLMPEMFAWTAVVILLSWIFGNSVLWLLKKAAGALSGGAAV